MSSDEVPGENAQLDSSEIKNNRGKLTQHILRILFLSVCVNTIPFGLTFWFIFSLWYIYLGMLILVGWVSLTIAGIGFAQVSRRIKASAIGIYLLGTFICFCLMAPIIYGFQYKVTPLHFAASAGQNLIVQGLLLTGSDINAQDFGQDTPLDAAIRTKHPSTVQALLEAGAEKNPDILVKAVESGEPKTVQVLLKAGAKLNGVDMYERTPLCLAAEKGSVEITKLLLQAGATNKTATTDVCSPLKASVQHNHPEITNLLIQAGAAAEMNESKAFCSAVEKGNLALMQRLLNLGANLQQDCPDGGTPLGAAAWNNQIEAVKLLLGMGADPNYVVSNFMTPLSAATGGGHTEVAKLLIQHGAEVNPTSSYAGYSPLSAAITSDHTDTVKLLIANGADVNQIDGHGASPLEVAASKKNTEMIKLLLKAGSKLEPNLLNIAAANSSPEVVKLLIEVGCDVNKAGVSGGDIQSLPLMAALQNYDNGAAILKVLIAKGAKLNVKNDLGEPIMITAIKSYNESSRIRVLIEAGADLNQPGSDGKTPLQLAKESGYTEIVQLLEQAGAK